MRGTHISAALTLLAGLAFVAVPAGAQVTCLVPNDGGSCTVNQDVTTNVPTAAQVVTAAAVSLPDVDPLSGVLPTTTTQVSVQANVAWSLTIQAASATWSGGDDTKPVEDLEWGAAVFPLDPPPPLKTMHTTPAAIAASQPAGLTVYNVLYRSTWSTADPPGAYSLTLVYTLTAP